MKKHWVLLFILCLFLGLNAFAREGDGETSAIVPIVLRGAILYENPSTESSVLRRLFVGEVIKIIETIKNDKGEIWGKVFVSPNNNAYIQGVYFSNTGSLNQELWKPQEVLRNEMPFSIALKGPSELFGLGIQMRYLPFARLGVTFSGGSVIENGKLQGTSMAYGFISILSMDYSSPFIEFGTNIFTYDDSHSAVRITSLYINTGWEWIFPSGYYFGLGVNYNRSIDAQVLYKLEYAKASKGNLEVGDYGPFNSVDGKTTFQRINPLFIFGYSF